MTYQQTKWHVQSNFQRGHRKGGRETFNFWRGFHALWHLVFITLFCLTIGCCTCIKYWLTVWLAIVDSRKMDIIRPAASVNLWTNIINIIHDTPEVPQSPDACLSWAFVVRGFISIINKVKMQEKIQRNLNFMTLTFALTFCMRGGRRWRRHGRRGYSNSSSALKCRCAKNWSLYHLKVKLYG